MEMLNNSSPTSAHHHHHHHHQSNNMKLSSNFDLGSSSADSHQYYFADNFFPHGWSNQKLQVMYPDVEKEAMRININGDSSSLFQNFVDSQIHQQVPPKLEDFLGGDSSSLTQDSSSLTHMYNYNDPHSHHHQDFKSLTGFQAFSTNSGSEVENSVGTEFGTNESCNELGYTTCVAPPPPLAPAPVPAASTGALSLAVNATTNHCPEKEKAIVAVVDESCKKISDTFGQRTSIYRDIDGQEDMKLIYGITAVEEKAKQEKDVKCPVPHWSPTNPDSRRVGSHSGVTFPTEFSLCPGSNPRPGTTPSVAPQPMLVTYQRIVYIYIRHSLCNLSSGVWDE
ncbi:hypothetical protein BC332_29686 [Capsicum chinense]|nr:hypothetical protein BC332_29686 [Capsicum chinense]